MYGRKTPQLLTPETALRGRKDRIPTAETHYISGRPLVAGRPDGALSVLFGMGCFWGAERLMWSLDGVWVTSVGYAGGFTPNPTYEETSTGQTGHAEVVEVVYDPLILSFENLLKAFWEGHDPTQGMRQGGDVGSQYRSAIYTRTEAQLARARAFKAAYDARLNEAGLGPITTEIGPVDAYYMAEDYHQQYLAKNPSGYCGIGGTGVSCPAAPGA
jgi:peptide-methionine (S)-S-oxide reductase